MLAEAPRPSGALLEGMTQHGVQGRGAGGSEARALAARARALAAPSGQVSPKFDVPTPWLSRCERELIS